MLKEFIHIWMALCFAAAFEVSAYIHLQSEYRDIEKRVLKIESIIAKEGL